MSWDATFPSQIDSCLESASLPAACRYVNSVAEHAKQCKVGKTCRLMSFPKYNHLIAAAAIKVGLMAHGYDRQFAELADLLRKLDVPEASLAYVNQSAVNRVREAP